MDNNKTNWLIKILAGAFVTVLISWTAWATSGHFKQETDIALAKQTEIGHYAVLYEKMERQEQLLVELSREIRGDNNVGRTNQPSNKYTR